MADTVLRKSSENFLSQAQTHQNFADHTRQMISQYQVHHNNLIDALQGTSLHNGVHPYLAWWEAFQSSMLEHADLHEHMATHLKESSNGFDEVDQNVENAFSESNQ